MLILLTNDKWPCLTTRTCKPWLLSLRVKLQIAEAVVSVVALLEGDAQQSTSQALMQPVLQPLQQQLQLQQHHPTNGAASVQTQDAAEIIGTLMDRLGVLLR